MLGAAFSPVILLIALWFQVFISLFTGAPIAWYEWTTVFIVTTGYGTYFFYVFFRS